MLFRYSKEDDEMKTLFLLIVTLLAVNLTGLRCPELDTRNVSTNHKKRNVTSTSFAEKSTEIFTSRYKIKKGNTINVYNFKGSIKLIGWNRDYVEIKAVKNAQGYRNDLEKIDILANSRNGLTIQTIDNTGNSKVIVNYTIRIPKSCIIGNIVTKGKISYKNL